MADWQSELKAKFGSSISRAFILHGNVQDYVAGMAGQTLRSYLVSSFSSKFDIVLVYSRSGGFWFPKPQMKKKFLEVVGLAVLTPTTPAGAGGSRQNSSSSGGLAGALNNRMSNPTQPSPEDSALEQISRQPAAALALITKMLAYRSAEAPLRAAVILEHAETLAPATEGAAASESDRNCYTILADWGRDQIVGSHGNLEQQRHAIFMVAAELKSLSEPLRRSGWEGIEIEMPDYEQRLEFIIELATEATNEAATIAKLAEGVTASQVARLTTGLTYRGIEDVFLRAAYSKQAVSVKLVKARKDELVAAEFNEVLRIVDSDFGFEVLGGMELLKEFLWENVISPMRQGQFEAVPQGLLMMGPAGTGKSRIAKALAKEAGVTFVELQPSKIFSKWVGETERSLERALTAIKAMTPCLVFVDEVDQSVQRGEGSGGDSGVSNRFFKRLLEFMADTTLRGKVLFIAATNRPDLLDAALKRAGRFDIKIPVLAPDPAERAAILRVLTAHAFASTKGAKVPNATAAVWSNLAEQMEGYTGAELELVVTKALRLYHKAQARIGSGKAEAEAEAEGSTSSTSSTSTKPTVASALEEAHSFILPATQDIEWMTRLALENCSDLELVPPAYRAMVRQLRANPNVVAQPSEENNQSHQDNSAALNGAGRGRRNRHKVAETDNLDI